MSLNYRQLSLINFPVFSLPSPDIRMEEGKLMCSDLIIDNTNLDCETLGARRLQISQNLCPLYSCYSTIQDLLLTKNNRVFIDNLGYPFEYNRTIIANIKYHIILKVLRKETATILKVQGVSFPVTVKRPPPPEASWAGMLYLKNRPWMLYDYGTYRCASKRRKI